MTWAVRHDRGAVAQVTLTRPERLNAFKAQDILELRDALEDLSCDSSIRVVLLTGAGRGFCAGGDLHAISEQTADNPSRNDAFVSMRHMAEVVELLHFMPKITIALANGACAGAGLSLALACDLRVAARSAVFLTSYVKVGQSGDYGQAWFLERLVGAGWSARLQLLSERIGAEAALQIGLVEEVVEDDQLGRRGEALAESVISMVPSAVAAIKRNLDDARELGLSRYLDEEAKRFLETMRSDESRQAVKAFTKSRPQGYLNPSAGNA